MAFAEWANAPARTKIHSIIMIFGCPAPLLNISILSLMDFPVVAAIAYMLESIKVTVIGTL